MYNTPTTPFQYDTTKLLWITQIGESGQVWHVTSDINRSEYQLWRGNKPTKYKSPIPTDLNKYIK